MTKVCDLCSQKKELKRIKLMTSDLVSGYSRRIQEIEVCSLCLSMLKKRVLVKILELD